MMVALSLLYFTSLLVPSMSGTSDQVCASKGQLGHRIFTSYKDNDQNDNGVVSGPEIYDLLSNSFDMDQDGCVSKMEWIDRSINVYKFSQKYAELIWPGDESRPCQLSVNDYKTSPLLLSKDKWLLTLTAELVEMCTGNPSLFSTNCDCIQLQPACEHDHEIRSNLACTVFIACNGKSSLVHRILANLRANDADDNKIVTGQEFVTDLTDNYDVNKDGCVNITEWVDRWTRFFNFSLEYAEGSFPGDESLSCPINISSYNDPGVQIPVDKFVSDNVQTLIDVCNTRDYSSLSVTNCDCDQLKDTCTEDAYFKIIESCLSYVACAGKGTLAQRLQTYVRVNDANDNKILTGPELYMALNVSYDVDSDGCVSLDEWTYRWVNFFNFSLEYAEVRFPGNKSAPCPLESKLYNDPKIQIPVDKFVDGNVQALIDICTSPDYPNLYKTNCDCHQLKTSCTNDPYFKTVAPCVAYATKT